MEITLKIFRYNPEVDKKFHYETYKIEAEETDRILDLLEHVKGYLDGTLSFRRSCAHGVCGSDAMRINGKNMLACKALVRDVGTAITVEPLLGLKVAKDLIVDMEPFFDNYKKVLPYFINDSPIPEDGRERLQSPEQRARPRAEAQGTDDARQDQAIHREHGKACESPHEHFEVQAAFRNGKGSRRHVYPPNVLRSTMNSANPANKI